MAASNSISEGHLQLSQRTEEQAASIEPTAAGMQHLADSFHGNAEHCRRAEALSGAAAQVARKTADELQAGPVGPPRRRRGTGEEGRAGKVGIKGSRTRMPMAASSARN